MFTFPEVIVTKVSRYVSDEIHITGKAQLKPRAVLSFVAVDETGARILNAPVAVVTLTGAAYNQFYAAWDSESSFYESLLTMFQNGTTGIKIEGVDMTLAGGALHVFTSAEVLSNVES